MACLWLGSLALPRMELLTDAGKHAFDGGSAQATCSACEAVVHSLSLAIRQPFESVERLGSRERWEALNRQLFLQQVLDPSRCTSAMKHYDLAFVPGVGTRFVFGAAARRLPVQMELNEWVKGELARFCEAFIEEYEESLSEIVLHARESDDLILNISVCKDQFNLCQLPKPSPQTTRGTRDKGTSAAKAKLKRTIEIFAGMDANADGKVNREEARLYALAAPRRQGEVVDVDDLFKKADQDGDGEVTLEEYKKFSVVPKLNSEDAKTEGFTQIAISHVLTVIENMRKAILEFKQDWRKHVGFGEMALALGTAAALAIGCVVMRRR